MLFSNDENAMNLQHLNSLFDVPLPPKILNLWRTRIEDLEAAHPGSGYSVGYSCIDFELTISIYGEISEDSLDVQSAVIWAEEFNSCCSLIPPYFDHIGKIAELRRRQIRGSGDKRHEFLCADFFVADDSSQFITSLRLTIFKGKFVKLRLSTRGITEKDAQMISLTCDEVAHLLWPMRGHSWSIDIPNMES